MSAYPVMLDGDTLSALVVGGGSVGTRKALGLLAAGAQVHVVAPHVTPALEQAAMANARLRIDRSRYDVAHLGEAALVIAATDDAAVNARIALDARGRLVNVVTAPQSGNCQTPAVHRAGDVVVAVTAGGVPAAAARIRDAIAARIDDRYAAAIESLGKLRRTLLNANERPRWIDASGELIGVQFCERVESGAFAAEVDRWR